MILCLATAAHAQPPSEEAPPQVRLEGPEARALFDELIARSPTAERLVDRLQQTDVIVYVRYRWFATETIDAHIGFLSSQRGAKGALSPAKPQHRFLIIELACGRIRLQQLAALGHELRHAVEIAESAATDASSLSSLYKRIGESVPVVGALEAYETSAAVEAGRRVRAELLDAPRASRAAAAKIHDAAAPALR